MATEEPLRLDGFHHGFSHPAQTVDFQNPFYLLQQPIQQSKISPVHNCRSSSVTRQTKHDGSLSGETYVIRYWLCSGLAKEIASKSKKGELHRCFQASLETKIPMTTSA
jgi:hypothetical protein